MATKFPSFSQGPAQDPTTRRIMEEILAQEEEHADDMASILESL